MRKLTLATATLLTGAVLGIFGWHVVGAAPALDTLVVCERAGADLRSPATNGSCPSGYTKTEITETAPTKVTAYQRSAYASGSALAQVVVNVMSIPLPEGSYTLAATGYLASPSGDASVTCSLMHGPNPVDSVLLKTSNANTYDGRALTGAVTITGAAPLRLDCTTNGPIDPSSTIAWKVTATKVDTLLAI